MGHLDQTQTLHLSPKCDIHRHFCPIFGVTAIFTILSTLISKIIVANLNFWCQDGAFVHLITTLLSKYKCIICLQIKFYATISPCMVIYKYSDAKEARNLEPSLKEHKGVLFSRNSMKALNPCTSI